MSISNNYLIKLGIFFFSIYAKLFPIFAVFVFSTKMRMLISAIVISLFLIFSLRHEINLMLSNGLEYALLSSHGIPSITRGFWYYSTKFNYFIDDSNYLIFKYFIMSIASLYGFIIFKLSFKFQKNYPKPCLLKIAYIFVEVEFIWEDLLLLEILIMH